MTALELIIKACEGEIVELKTQAQKLQHLLTRVRRESPRFSKMQLMTKIFDLENTLGGLTFGIALLGALGQKEKAEKLAIQRKTIEDLDIDPMYPLLEEIFIGPETNHGGHIERHIT